MDIFSALKWTVWIALFASVTIGAVLLAARHSTFVFLCVNTIRVFLCVRETIVKRLTLIEFFGREWKRNYGKVAIEFEDRKILYEDLDKECRRIGNFALKEEVRKDEVVAIFSPNTPEYLFVYYGMASVGVTVAFINADAQGPSLEHALLVAKATRIIVHPSKQDQLLTINLQPFTHIYVLPECASSLKDPSQVTLKHPSFQCVCATQLNDDTPIDKKEIAHLAMKDAALYIYTSGTTGMPKATRLTHRKMVQYPILTTYLSLRKTDKMFVCLPLFHTSGLAFGTSMFYHGGTLVLSRRFSTRHTYQQIVDSKSTVFLYIGELCRYLMATPDRISKQKNYLRKCIGNGLRRSIWVPFQEKFRVPQMMEFYTATESGFALFNFDNTIGAVGYLPPILLKVMEVRIVKYNVEEDKYIRNDKGFLQNCDYDEAGELISRVIFDDKRVLGGKFSAYTNEKDTSKKLLKDVFQKGDTWWRSGDILKMDSSGNYFFVDRIGDTFRFKGHNVSTAEVEQVFNHTLTGSVQHVSVYGMDIDGVDGKCGMACICVDDPKKVNIPKLSSTLASSLQSYAIPRLLRFKTNFTFTSTFKIKKHNLVKEGYDVDHLYAWDASQEAFVKPSTSIHHYMK